MKLYLLSTDDTALKRWENGLADLNPIRISALSSITEPDAIVMVLDRVLQNVPQDECKKLFSHSVMVFSMTPNFEEAQKYLQWGAMGYGNAMMHEYHLHSVYQALEEGKVWLHPDFISLMISQIRDTAAAEEKSSALLNGLSKREQEVAVMLGNGSTHQQIADALDITVRTVKAHATAIYQKLDVKDRLALSLLLHG